MRKVFRRRIQKIFNRFVFKRKSFYRSSMNRTHLKAVSELLWKEQFHRSSVLRVLCPYVDFLQVACVYNIFNRSSITRNCLRVPWLAIFQNFVDQDFQSFHDRNSMTRKDALGFKQKIFIRSSVTGRPFSGLSWPAEFFLVLYDQKTFLRFSENWTGDPFQVSYDKEISFRSSGTRGLFYVLLWQEDLCQAVRRTFQVLSDL